MILGLLIAWLAAVLLLSYGITRQAARVTSGYFFRLVIFPGVVVHELSHYLLCLATGAKVFEVKFFEKRQEGNRAVYGGHVTHGPSKLPIVGEPLISFAPIFGCTAAIVLLTYIADDPLGLFLASAIETGETAIPPLGSLLSAVAGMAVRVPVRVIEHAGDWKFWGYLYLVGSLGIALAPSRQDFANSFRHVLQNFLKVAALGAVIWLIVRLFESNVAVLVSSLFGVMAFSVSILAVMWLAWWAAATLVTMRQRT